MGVSEGSKSLSCAGVYGGSHDGTPPVEDESDADAGGTTTGLSGALLEQPNEPIISAVMTAAERARIAFNW
jgi:hypothetical protein